LLTRARTPEILAGRRRGNVRRGSYQARRVCHINDADIEDWQSSIDIVPDRFAEYQDLEAAFARRPNAPTERAKS
jgi:hypothetical protein